jgi:hypothetical protein
LNSRFCAGRLGRLSLLNFLNAGMEASKKLILSEFLNMKHQAFSAKWSGNKPVKPPNTAYGLLGKAFSVSTKSDGFHVCFHLPGLTCL